ncbi:MAG TPA: TIGR02266 family protein [Kofleriaceae bacterium]|nr:TIGR02266 family protein [Kofleriaceae bacterium]
MADPNTRTGKRTPVTLKIKFKSETLEQFIERYAVDVSQGGIFIRTKEPLAVGTQMRFEFQLRDASPLIGGEGTVVWTRENDPSRPAIAPGMGVRFDRLAEGSQGVLERILAEKAKQAPNRPASDSIKPPLFTDTPTRVAPAPLAEQLLAGAAAAAAAHKIRRRPEDNEHTPLPKPMPFHSDADEFPDEAFEEATKVRALDELVAQTAEQAAAAEELASSHAAHHHNGREAAAAEAAHSPFGDVDAAPGLPSPPEPEELEAPPMPAREPGRMLDATPSPRTEESPPPAPVDSLGGRTKLGLGLEAPRMQSPSAAPLGSPGPGPSIGGPMSQTGPSASSGPKPARAVAAESTAPVRRDVPAKRGSGAAIAILILVLLAAGAAGVWFFVLRDRAAQPAAGSSSQIATDTGSGSDTGAGSAPAAGSGSDQMATGSGSAQVETPKAPIVETVIDSSVPKARVEVAGTDQSGTAPFTAKLEKDRPYKVRVSSPGYASLEIDVVGGAPKHTAALVPKPRVISFKTDPPGALIVIDGVGSKLTPQEIELPRPPAAGKPVRIRLSKKGYKPIDKSLPANAFVEDDAQMIATIDEKLTAVQAVVRPPPDRGSGAATGSGTPGEGSGTPAGKPPGDGSAAAPPPPPPAGGEAPGGGESPGGGEAPGGGESAEPEPSFNNTP